jgi:CDP-diacylglycerol--glycerol-3-phosphate 3-phosphatidyltransferase
VGQPPLSDGRPTGRRPAREAGADAAARATEAAEKARLTFRRLVGLDRSGPPPPETLAGQPLRPWTIPNAIGFVRVALLPVFLAFALTSGDGVSATAVALFALIGASDYLDGIAARLTGQYSRLGTLLDPLVDRLLIISGVVVCWSFELLPRWALAVLVARELFMLGLVRWGLHHGFDVSVNWLGRAGVWPIMSALFLAMAGLQGAGAVCLYAGLVLVLGSTAQYVREGLRLRRAQRPSS